ncbi:MAG: YeeE/YedE family protein [Alphaproteobacteria bacterium]|nr:YeeE/YedE family protein [Alphaproteobacteria bacterium]
MENFTPGAALLGGALIGLSAAILMLYSGRIAGISGIVGGLLSRQVPGAEMRWRLAFLAGLIAGPALVNAVVGGIAPITLDASIGLLVGAGLLVGIGTRIGGGCTSGHGVCGMARLSPRSMVATMSFLATAILIAYLVRHAAGG